ncbi:MAG: hypothetical protein WDA42_09580 [Candidatus Bathyarchaeia archaeon]
MATTFIAKEVSILAELGVKTMKRFTEPCITVKAVFVVKPP